MTVTHSILNGTNSKNCGNDLKLPIATHLYNLFFIYLFSLLDIAFRWSFVNVISHYRSFTTQYTFVQHTHILILYTIIHKTHSHIPNSIQHINTMHTHTYSYTLCFVLHSLLTRACKTYKSHATCHAFAVVLCLLLLMCSCSIKQTFIRFLWGDFISKCLSFFFMPYFIYINFHYAFPENSLVFPLISMRIHYVLHIKKSEIHPYGLFADVHLFLFRSF